MTKLQNLSLADQTVESGTLQHKPFPICSHKPRSWLSTWLPRHMHILSELPNKLRTGMNRSSSYANLPCTFHNLTGLTCRETATNNQVPAACQSWAWIVELRSDVPPKARPLGVQNIFYVRSAVTRLLPRKAHFAQAVHGCCLARGRGKTAKPNATSRQLADNYMQREPGASCRAYSDANTFPD